MCRHLLVCERNHPDKMINRMYASKLVYGRKTLFSPVYSTPETVDTFVYAVYASTGSSFSWFDFPPSVILLVSIYLRTRLDFDQAPVHQGFDNV